MSKLPQAVEALTRVSEAQLEAARAERRRLDRREAAERFESAEFQADLAAARRPMRRLSARAFIRAAPWVFAAAFDGEVPPEYFVQIADGAFAVACPCGVDHIVGGDGYPMGAECGRYFLYDGESMRVWRGVDEPSSGVDTRPES